MKKEIKDRIDKIKIGEVPKGYKHIGIGIIPNEWNSNTTSGDIFNFYGSLSASRDQLSDKGYCYLHYGDIHKSDKQFINVENEINVIPKLDIELSRVPKTSLLCDGDMVFVDASEDYEGTSKHIVVQNPRDVPFIAGLHTIVGKSKNSKLNNSYKKYCFQSSLVKKQFNFYATGVKVYGLSKSNIEKIKLPIPTLPEQEKIAEILTTWDKAIELKVNNIKALELRKKWIMNKLISPIGNEHIKIGNVIINKSNWDMVKLEDFCDIIKGDQIDKVNLLETGNYYALNGGIEPSGFIEKWNTLENTISISEGGASCGFVNFNTKKFWSGGHCYTLEKLVDKIDRDFLYFYLKFKEIDIMALRVGSGLPNIQKSALSSFKIICPTLLEQTTIANILTTKYLEINLCKKELEKLKLQKKSLMQLLLTGIVRVS